MDDRRARVLGAIAGGALAGLLLGALDVAILLARGISAFDVSEGARLLAAGTCAGAIAGAAASVLLAPVVARWRAWPRPRRGAVAGAAAAIAVAGCLADAFLYANLYREAHLWVGALALGAAVLAGGLLFPGRGAVAGSLAAAACAIAAGWLGPAALGGSQRLWQPILAHSTLPGRVAGLLWAAPEAPAAAQGCRFRAPAPVSPRGGAEGMNVLLVTVDALRGDLGGDRLAETLPELARRLPDAYRFDRAYAPANLSTVSDTAVLRGRWPHRLSFTPTAIDAQDRFQPVPPGHPMLLDPRTWRQRPPMPLDDPSPTLAELLARGAGLRTLTVVPWVFFLREGGIPRGFERIDDRPYQERNRDIEGVTSDLMTDRALALLGELRPDERWMLWLHYMDPHAPYAPYGDVPESAAPFDRYLGELRRVDHELGRLLDGVAERGELARTLVVVWSDHGEEFREHGGQFHGTTLFEEQIRVAALLRVPGRAGRLVGEVISLVDLAPTVVDLLGVRSVATFDGRSLTPLLRGEPWERGAVLSFGMRADRQLEAVVEGDLKLIEQRGGGAVQLFDLAADPRERRNLADERPGDVARLRCILAAAGVAPRRDAFDSGGPLP